MWDVRPCTGNAREQIFALCHDDKRMVTGRKRAPLAAMADNLNRLAGLLRGKQREPVAIEAKQKEQG